MFCLKTFPKLFLSTFLLFSACSLEPSVFIDNEREPNDILYSSEKMAEQANIDINPQELIELVVMNIDINPKEIIVGQHNYFQQKAIINWEISNMSTMSLNTNEYVLEIGYSRINDESVIIITTIDKEIKSLATEKGTIEKVFEAVHGANGDYELKLTLYEKIDFYSMHRLKQVSTPFTWQVNIPK